jgi:hypothetical protein
MKNLLLSTLITSFSLSALASEYDCVFSFGSTIAVNNIKVIKDDKRSEWGTAIKLPDLTKKAYISITSHGDDYQNIDIRFSSALSRVPEEGNDFIYQLSTDQQKVILLVGSISKKRYTLSCSLL